MASETGGGTRRSWMVRFPPMSAIDSDTSTCLPAAALRPYISTYAGFRIAGLQPGTIIGLPSRNIDLIVSFGAPITILAMPDQSRPAAYQALLGGLQLSPAVVRQGGTPRLSIGSASSGKSTAEILLQRADASSLVAAPLSL
jgi:hypothetical protein